MFQITLTSLVFRFRTIGPQATKSLSSVIINILNCELDRLSINVLTHYFMVKWGKAFKALPYRQCLLNNKFNKLSEHEQFELVSSCLPWLTQSCLSSNIRAIKSIRMPAMLAEAIMSEDPSIKFIYYPRDPRAIIVSRSAFKIVNLTVMAQVESQAIKQCTWMTEDVKHLWNATAHTDTVLSTRYEDFARNPIDISKEIHEFLEISVPPSLPSWILRNTNVKKPNGLLGTARNSAQTVDKWREKFSQEANEVVLKHCKYIFRILHYSEHL